MRSCSFSVAGVWATAGFGLGIATVGGTAAVWNRPMSPQPARAEPSTRHSAAGAARRRRRLPRPCRSSTPFTSLNPCLAPLGPYPCRLVCAQQLDLTHEAHIDTRPRIPLDPAPDANTSIFQGLKDHAGAFERPYHAL